MLDARLSVQPGWEKQDCPSGPSSILGGSWRGKPGPITPTSTFPACPRPPSLPCSAELPLLPGRAKRAQGPVVTNRLGAISAALRTAGKTPRVPRGRGQRRQRNRGGSGGAAKAPRVTISVHGPSPSAEALPGAKSHSPRPGKRQSHALVAPAPRPFLAQQSPQRSPCTEGPSEDSGNGLGLCVMPGQEP